MLTREAKRRREAADAFAAAGRTEQASAERAEGEVLDGYLPAQLGDDEIAAIVTAGIEQTGASGMKAMGQVMKVVTPQTAGRADGGRVAAEVRRQLGRLVRTSHPGRPQTRKMRSTALSRSRPPVPGGGPLVRGRPAAVAAPAGAAPAVAVRRLGRSRSRAAAVAALAGFFGGAGLFTPVPIDQSSPGMSLMAKPGAGLARFACMNVICQVCAGASAPNISPGQPSR